jgi:hypothetical protein
MGETYIHTHIGGKKNSRKGKTLVYYQNEKEYSIHVLHMKSEVQPEICMSVKDLLKKKRAPILSLRN